MNQIQSNPIIYEPMFDPETNRYKDESPFQKREKGIVYACSCRHRNDLFSTMTAYKNHTKNKYHTSYISEYGKIVNEEYGKVKKENDILKKENAIQGGNFEKLNAQKDRDIDILTNNLIKMTLRKNYYKNKNVEVEEMF